MWRWFRELNRCRPIKISKTEKDTVYDRDPLTYADIWYWMRVTGRNPSPFEINALFLLDNCHLSVIRGTSGASPVTDVAETLRRGFATMKNDKPDKRKLPGRRK